MKQIKKAIAISFLFMSIGIMFCVNAQSQNMLNVIANGNGSVSGTGMYSSGTSVQISATPASGWVFTGWTGSITSSSNPYTVTVYSAMTIYANFSQSATASQWTSNGASIYYMGGVGIGTNTVNYKLTVAGDIYANNGWLRTSGNAGWYSESYGGGLYMADGDWIRTYGNKNFYHNTGIMRTDGSLQVGPNGDRFVVLQGGYTGIGNTSPNYKLDVAGDINFTGNLLQNGQPFSGGGSSFWSQPGYDISSNGDVLIPGDYKLKFGNRGVATSGHFYIFSSPTLYNTYADISQGSLYFRKANYGDNNGAILGIQSDKTVTINYWETYDNNVIDTKGHALAVNGGVWSHYITVDGKVSALEVEVKPDVWADDVFAKNYKLMPLVELEQYINAHQHLPSVPTEVEVKEKGINVGDMNATLLRKVEELTKYVIEQQKAINELKDEIKSLKAN